MPDPSEKPEKSDDSPPPRRLHPNPRMTASLWWVLAVLAIVGVRDL